MKSTRSVTGMFRSEETLRGALPSWSLDLGSIDPEPLDVAPVAPQQRAPSRPTRHMFRHVRSFCKSEGFVLKSLRRLTFYNRSYGYHIKILSPSNIPIDYFTQSNVFNSISSVIGLARRCPYDVPRVTATTKTQYASWKGEVRRDIIKSRHAFPQQITISQICAAASFRSIATSGPRGQIYAPPMMHPVLVLHRNGQRISKFKISVDMARDIRDSNPGGYIEYRTLQSDPSIIQVYHHAANSGWLSFREREFFKLPPVEFPGALPSKGFLSYIAIRNELQRLTFDFSQKEPWEIFHPVLKMFCAPPPFGDNGRYDPRNYKAGITLPVIHPPDVITAQDLRAECGLSKWSFGRAL